VRSDITRSLDGGTTVDGVPLDLTFSLTDMANDDAPFEGAAVYAWQCDAQGLYSMYSEGIEDETYLRGIQVADADGVVSFSTIVPGCYPGRWPHIHFEVYESLKSATRSGTPVKTTQLAFPRDVCEAVYATEGYSRSADELSGLSLETDNVFSDGHELQLATVTGSAAGGYKAVLTVPL